MTKFATADQTASGSPAPTWSWVIETTWAVDFAGDGTAPPAAGFAPSNVLDEGVREGWRLKSTRHCRGPGDSHLRTEHGGLARTTCQVILGATAYICGTQAGRCGQFSPVPSERPLCTKSANTPNGLPRGEALLTIVMSLPLSLDRTPHSRRLEAPSIVIVNTEILPASARERSALLGGGASVR